MPILYDNPKEVGADRIANAVGAYRPLRRTDDRRRLRHRHHVRRRSPPRASTSAARSLPGIEISLDALFGRAAALRRVELVEPRSVIGKNTVESIQSGAVYGFAAQVDGIAMRIEDEHRRRQRGRHRRPGRSDRAVLREHRVRRAVAHAARPPPHLREEPHLTRELYRVGPRRRRPTKMEPAVPEIPNARSRTASRRPIRRRRSHERFAGLAPSRSRPITGSPSPAGCCCAASRASSPSAPSQDGTRPHPAVRPRRQRRPTSMRFAGLLARRLDRRHRRGHDDQDRRAVGARSTSGSCWPRPAAVPRQVARHHRPRHALPAALRRPVGHRRGPAHVPAALAAARLDPPLAGGPRLHRGRDPGLPPDPGRRARPSRSSRTTTRSTWTLYLRIAPELYLKRLVVGGFEQGLRDRPGVPQRGSVATATTPSSRCSSSTRPTPTTPT